MLKRSQIHVGVDEAGLGPNLGPLVIVATHWSGTTCHTDELWDLFPEAVSREPEAERLHVGDSKAVYRTKRDFSALESTAIALLQAAGFSFSNLPRLIKSVDPTCRDGGDVPWLVDDGIGAEQQSTATLEPVRRLADVVAAAGWQLRVAVHFSPAIRFNRALAMAESKGALLSTSSLETLCRVWSPDDGEALVWCDKHGGRNRYAELLQQQVGRYFVTCGQEGREQSTYHVGDSEITFGVRSERHFPVACASLIAKYLRQCAMRAFNSWWCDRVPDLRPTEGYPQDARRFRDDVSAMQRELGIADDALWRRK